jgi:SAM-dependent methyltransferase
MHKCRICGNDRTTKFLSLGQTPLANSFLRSDQLNDPEAQFPLNTVLCEQCGLVQLDHVVPPELMFRNYIYVSSTSRTMPAHFAAYSREIVDRFLKPGSDLVVEMGSNDGCLLRAFRSHGIRCLGVEPATNLAELANEDGVATINDFFCQRVAREILDREGPAKVVIGNNVLAHIDNLQDLLAGLDVLLRPDGVAVFEMPYLVDLLRNDEFDTVYHEHLSYFALRPLQRLFESRGMRIFDAERSLVHGGSVRVYFGRAGTGPELCPSVQRLFSLEEYEGLLSAETYFAFGKRVHKMKDELTGLLSQFKSDGARIAGYGAPAKGNTLLNYFKIGTDLLDFIVDRSQYKQGMYTPGTHIPVFDVDQLLKQQPDYVLVLAWNFLEEIMDQQSEYLNRGGKFVVPIPQPRIVDRIPQTHAAFAQP